MANETNLINQWISGIVVIGDGRGRQLGFPTANVTLDKPTQRPAVGVYAGWARLQDSVQQHPAAIHVGPRPTYDKSAITVEIHLLNFPDKSLYGQTLLFMIVEKIRDVQKFSDSATLSAAIKDDCTKTLELLQ